MRFLVKVEMEIEAANRQAKAGKLGETVKAILAEQKPEAAYFMTSNGRRCAVLIVDMKDASQLPALAEPWFLAFNASLEAAPVMAPADLEKAGPAIAAAAKKYG